MSKKEYTIRISFTVDAQDYDEAVEIAKAVRREIDDASGTYRHRYKLRDVETYKIEEL